MKFVCALIVVKDIKQSREFYENVLKQKIKYDYGEDMVFEGDFAIHLESHFKKLMGFRSHEITKRSNNFELYFETNEIEAMYSRLVNERVEFIHGIVEQPWGQRVFRFYDLDGYMIEIGESMEYFAMRLHNTGLTIDEICDKTSLPREFVEHAVEQ